MGFFDRFKKKNKEDKRENNNTQGQTETADLQSEINAIFKEKNDEAQKQMSEWHKTEQAITSHISAGNNSSTTKYLDDIVTEQTKKFMTEMAEKEFDESFVGKKYKIINNYLTLASLGFNTSQPNDKMAEKICTVFLKLGYTSKENVLLPFLLEREAKGILTSTEEKQLNLARNTMNEDEFAKCLGDAMLIMDRSGLFDSSTKADILTFEQALAVYDKAKKRKSQSRK